MDVKDSPNWALFLNCLGNEKLYESILQELTKDERCNKGHTHKWPVNNKYYSADIFIHTVHAPPSGHTPLKGACPGVLQSVTCHHSYQALVMFVDMNSNSAEVISEQWSRVCDELEEVPDICVLVTVLDNHDDQLLQDLLHWSVKKGLELIEWGSVSEEEEEEEEREQSGVERLSEVLQSHMWPVINLHTTIVQTSTRKETSSPGGGNSAGATSMTSDPCVTMAATSEPCVTIAATSEPCVTMAATSEPCVTMAATSEPCVTVAATSEPCVTVAATSEPIVTACDTISCEARATEYSSVEEKLLAEGLDSCKDCGGDSFEQLFSKFAAMKDHAESLSHEERKVYAEKVVMAFWDAVGGDEEEIRDSNTTQQP